MVQNVGIPAAGAYLLVSLLAHGNHPQSYPQILWMVGKNPEKIDTYDGNLNGIPNA